MTYTDPEAPNSGMADKFGWGTPQPATDDLLPPPEPAVDPEPTIADDPEPEPEPAKIPTAGNPPPADETRPDGAGSDDDAATGQGPTAEGAAEGAEPDDEATADTDAEDPEDPDSAFDDPAAESVADDAAIDEQEQLAYARIVGTERAKQRRHRELHAGSADSWDPIDLTDHMDGTATPPTPTMWRRTDGINLLYPGLTHSLFGENESGKSFVALAITAEQIIAARRVLYLDYENDPALIAERLRLLSITTAQAATHLDYRRPETAPDPTNLSWASLLATPYDLVVIDGVTAALATHGINSNDNDEITRWWRDVPNAIATRTGAAVLLIDHVTKSNDGRGRYPLGAQAKLSNISGAAYMLDTTKDPIAPGALGKLTVRCAKDRPGQVRRHGTDYRASDRSHLLGTLTIDSTAPTTTTVRLDPGAPPASLSTAAADETERRTRIMTYITRHTFEAARAGRPVPTFTKTSIRAEMGTNREQVYATIDCLESEGYLTRLSPRSGYKMEPAKPYPAAIDTLKTEASTLTTHPSDPTE
ncbi:AAA family ATPase [Gordonia sp. NPDC057258]|uniref:AAA family ATPase n=1 Tax=unclassified Gordonia (in: high G+C Gram-positive bacteria) TaxID=2657482 RepID=UPI003638087E